MQEAFPTTSSKARLVHENAALVPRGLLVIAAAFFGFGGLVQAQEDRPETAARPAMIEIGEYAFVTTAQGDYLAEALDVAVKAGAPAIVLKIDCRGGLAAQARRFAEQLAAVEVPSVAWVSADCAGAGVIAAMAADRIYLAPSAALGGEVTAIDWRGPSEDLPSRLVELRYDDVAEDLVRILEPKNRPAGLVNGFCDPGVEVVLGGEKYSDEGDVLELDLEDALAVGLVNGEAASIDDVVAAESLPGAPVELFPAPEVKILRDADESGSGARAESREEDADAPDGGDAAPKQDDAGDEQTAFGETRQESYAGKVVVIPVQMESLIRKTKFEFIARQVRKADEDGAEAIIFDLNTPGGIAWYTQEMMLSDLQGLSVPTYSFVNPKAMSAGALLAIATDHIYMHPPSTIGAAAPVSGSGHDIPETMLKKVISDILATADDVARSKGHNPDIARAFIDSEAELNITLPVISAEGHLTEREALEPITDEELLVLNSSDAVQIVDGRPLFAEGTATSVADLVKKVGLQGEVVRAKPLGFEAVADWLVKMAPWLLLFGMAGAYMELKAPGFGVPGFIALICFGLFFFGHNVAGYLAGFEAIGVFILGAALLLVEFFVFPGLLIFGILGAVMMFGALIYAMVPADMDWGAPLNMSGIGELITKPALNLTIGLIGAGLLIVLALRYLPSTPMFRWLILDSEIDKGTGLKFAGDAGAVLAEGAPEASEGGEVDTLIGRTGVTATDLRPAGAALFGDDRLDVVSLGDFIDEGTPVRIVEHEGSRIAVEAV